MAGIKHLSEIYKKQGAEFLDELFSKELTVSEKLNGMSFAFEKNIGDGTISFYKRDQENPISKIDRVLMKYYDGPIIHIQNLPGIIVDEIPIWWRFGMEFFINPSPVLISYGRIPKNGLVLTHIVCKNEYGDIEKTIVEKEELDYWADLLDIEKAPIIFQGKLSDEQKVSINDFINSPYDSLNKSHGTYSFAKYLTKILNPDISKSALNDSLDQPIEGIVFRFGSIDGSGDSFTAKMLDPMFEDITRQNNIKKVSYFPSDIYGITIIDVMNFILDKNISSFPYEGEDPQDKYLSFISSVFNSFIEENGEKYLGLDFQEPEFLKKEGFESNLDLIKDEKTRELIGEDESYESLFKLILSAFRKIKKKAGGFFTQGAIEQFNILVREISQYLNEESIIESAIPTFDQFRKIKKPFIPQEEKEEEPEEEEPEEEPIKPKKEPKIDPVKLDKEIEEDPILDELPIETPEQKDELPVEISGNESPHPDPDIVDKIKDILGQGDPISSLPKENQTKDVNLIIGEFQPFNNGHLKLIKKASQNNNLPVVVFVVKSGNKCFIDDETLDKMMRMISNDMSDVIDSVHYVDDNLLSTSLGKLDKEYMPKTLTTGKKKSDNYVLQARSLKRRKKLDTEFLVQTAPEWIDQEDVRKNLYDKNYAEFKKKVPKSVSLLWDDLLRCYHA